jgi:hypothetical protein
VRTDDSPATSLRDHLFGGVLIAEHGATRIHRHLPVKRLDRCCIPQVIIICRMRGQHMVFPLVRRRCAFKVYLNSLSKNCSKVAIPALATICNDRGRVNNTKTF